MIKVFQQGGQMNSEQEEFTAYLISVLEPTDQSDFEAKIKSLGEDQIKQLYQKFKQEKTVMAKNGSKLNYFNKLNGIAEKVDLFKTGGCIECNQKKIDLAACGGKAKKKKRISKNQDGGIMSKEQKFYNSGWGSNFDIHKPYQGALKMILLENARQEREKDLPSRTYVPERTSTINIEGSSPGNAVQSHIIRNMQKLYGMEKYTDTNPMELSSEYEGDFNGDRNEPYFSNGLSDIYSNNIAENYPGVLMNNKKISEYGKDKSLVKLLGLPPLTYKMNTPTLGFSNPAQAKPIPQLNIGGNKQTSVSKNASQVGSKAPQQKKENAKFNGSIVDYLVSKGIDHSLTNRRRMYEQMFGQEYDMNNTAASNLRLLSALQSGQDQAKPMAQLSTPKPIVGGVQPSSPNLAQVGKKRF